MLYLIMVEYGKLTKSVVRILPGLEKYKVQEARGYKDLKGKILGMVKFLFYLVHVFLVFTKLNGKNFNILQSKF